MQCSRCAYPATYWKSRCDRCGAHLHSLRERILVPAGIVLVVLVLFLLLL
jgi:predicted amidophosphoribosyltransferase